MPALTFETLSTDLTQALLTVRDTPPDTTARCTLGRDKVMVLVEYPADSGSAEAMATQTLDWLEEALREQFETKGLPDTAADLAEGGAEVAVQLFLKHASEAKPFTMRSFIWKVEDGFDDLFGGTESFVSDSLDYSAQAGERDRAIESVLNNAQGGDSQPVFQRANGFKTRAAVIDADITEPAPNAQSLDAASPLDSYEEADEPVPIELEEDHLPLELEPEPDFETELGVLPSVSGNAPDIAYPDIAHPDIAPDIEESLEEALIPSDSLTLDAPTLAAKHTEDIALEADLAAELEADLAADLSPRVASEITPDLAPDLAQNWLFRDDETEFSLPGEAPDLSDDDFNLPTLELPGANVPDIGPADAAFFNISDEASDEKSFASSASLDLPLPQEASSPVESLATFLSESESALDSTSEAHSTLETSELTELDLSDSAFEDSDTSGLAPSDLDLSDSALSDLDTMDSEASRSEASRLDTSDLDFGHSDLNDSDLNDSDLNDSDLNDSDLGDLGSDLSDLNDLNLQTTDAQGLHQSHISEEEPALLDDSIIELYDSVIELDSEPNEAPTWTDTADEVAADEIAADEISEQQSHRESNRLAETLSDDSSDHFGPTLPPLVPPDADLQEDASLDSELDSDDSASDITSDRELGEYDPVNYEAQYAQAAYEEESYEEENFEEDPTYYLEEGEADVEEETFEEVAAIEEGEVQRQREQWKKQSRKNPWIFAGALGFALVGVIGFVATRPCTVGSCDRIQTAQDRTEEAIRDLRADGSQKSVIATQKQIKQSIGLIKPIPFWSPHYAQAQNDLPYYQAQVRSLDLVSSAQSKAYRAAKDSQDPPHPVAQWQKIANDWLAATEALKSVPTDSPIRELADRKISEYRANRATILVRIDAESKAEASLIQAQNNASTGNKQLDAATSAEDWEEALASWEAAVENLNQIPQGTSAYADAQTLLPEYTDRLDEVRVRANREASANDNLTEAKQLAAAAQRTETEEQWSASIDNWRRAQGELRGIPEGTLVFAEAKALLRLYGAELNRAENNIQAALKFQAVEPEFFTACGVTTTQICTYSVRAGKIRMDLFEGYDSVIDQSITPPDQRAASPVSNDGTIQVISPQFVDGGNQLLRNITLLGARTRVPIELYDAAGDLLATYRPDLEGFTR